MAQYFYPYSVSSDFMYKEYGFLSAAKVKQTCCYHHEVCFNIVSYAPPLPLLYILSVEYMSHFGPRDLKAFSVEPLLIYPTHYTGEPGYISDTETSTIWDDDAVATDWDRQHARKTAQQGRIRPVAQNSVTGDSPPPAARASRDEL